MKKIKLSRKTKVFLSFGTGLLATTSIVTPLVCSCSTSDDNTLKEFDKQFNLDDYKNQVFAAKCESACKTYLEHQGKTTEEINEELKSLHDNLHNIIKKGRNLSNSSTVASNVMVDVMFDRYGIKMSRDFDASINFDLEINNFRETCVSSIVRMMQEKKIPSSKIDGKVNDFNVKFRKLRAELSDKYDDGLSILYNIKHDAWALLDGISDEMDQVASAIAFDNFFKRYEFVVNNELVKKNNNYWNNIYDKHYDGENVSKLVSEIFVLRDKNAIDPKKAELPINPVALANGGIMADYRIEPLWRGATGDMYNNKYSFSIEWRAIKVNNFKRYQATGDKNIYLNTVTTLSSVKDKNDTLSIKSTRDILNLSSDKKSYRDYPLAITADYEKSQLKKAYSQIHLGWDDGQGGLGSMANCAYEGYFGFENSTKALSLSDNQIGAIGLTVGSAYTNSVTRLDALKQQVQSKVNAGADFDSLSLEEKFVDSVDLVTFSEVTNDKKHIVDNKFYAAYKNSPYADKSNTQNTYTYFEDWNSHIEGMPISQHLYDTTWISFKKSNQEAQDENLKKAEDLKNDTQKDWDVAKVAEMVFIGITISLGIYIASPWGVNKPQAGAMLTMNVICTVWNTWILGMYADISNKAIDYYNDVKKWHDDQRYTDYMVDHVKNDYAKYLSSYDLFKSAPMSKIKPMVSYYNTLQLQREYQKCLQSQKENQVDWSRYDTIRSLIHMNLGFTVAGALGVFACLVVLSFASVAHRAKGRAVSGIAAQTSSARKGVTALSKAVADGIIN